MTVRTLPHSTAGFLLMAACQAPDLKDTAVLAREAVDIGVDIDVRWDLAEPDRYQIQTVVTLSTVEVRENPGGVLIDEQPQDACDLHVFAPDTAHHNPYYTDVPALDAGPTVIVTIGDTRMQLPAVDDTGGRYYVLETDSVTVPLTFPASVGVELSGEGEDGLPAATLADAAWVPAPFGWTGPDALTTGARPELPSSEDLILTWEGATTDIEEGFTVWINNTGVDNQTGDYWEQLACPVADDGAFTVVAANQEAMHLGDADPLRTVQLERYSQANGVSLAEGFQGSYFASQIRSSDYVPVAE